MLIRLACSSCSQGGKAKEKPQRLRRLTSAIRSGKKETPPLPARDQLDIVISATETRLDVISLIRQGRGGNNWMRKNGKTG